MALIKCTECGKEFSDKAPSCPSCGCPLETVMQEKARLDEQAEAERREEEAKHKEAEEQKRLEDERNQISAPKICIICAVIALLAGIMIFESLDFQEDIVSTDTPVEESSVVNVSSDKELQEEQRRLEAEQNRREEEVLKEEKRERAEMSRLRTFLRSEVDTVENYKIIDDKSTPKYLNSKMAYAYIVEIRDVQYVRMRFGFSRGEWIFTNRIVANIDGVVIDIPSSPEHHRTHIGNDGNVYEWFDILADTYALKEILWIIAESKSAQIKFSGTAGSYSFTISKKQKNGIKHILRYNELFEKWK